MTKAQEIDPVALIHECADIADRHDDCGGAFIAEKIRELAFSREATAAQADVPQEPKYRWRHKKRGTTYIEIGRGNLQIATDPVEEDDRVVIYQSEADGRLWVRGEAEFGDGRFEALAAQADTPTIDNTPSCGQENDYRRDQPQSPRQWPRVFSVTRAANAWHGEISFAHRPTDEQLEALEVLLRDDHQPAPSLSRPDREGK
jgi:hypothetical protein